MNPATDIFVAEGVGKQFGGFVALKDVSVSFAREKLSAIIGPNGAGKSTFFNAISGAFAPSSGRITFEGNDITGLAPHEYARRGIAKSFQITNVFPQLSAHENVRVAAQMQHTQYNLWTPRVAIRELIEQADHLLERVGIVAKRNALARDMGTANSAAWRSPWRWRASRACYCWMSPPQVCRPKKPSR